MQASTRGVGRPTMNPVEVEKVVAPAAIERALAVYQQMRQQDHSVLMQARKILTQHIWEWSIAGSTTSSG
jgi:hypothetical protein